MSDLNPDYQKVLDAVSAIVAADSHSAASLVLFALMKTLSAEQGQYLFLLNKLRDLDAAERRLAYQLMDLMTREVNHSAEWHATVEAIEARIRGAD